MESNCCGYVTQSGNVGVQKKDFVMDLTAKFRKLMEGAAITVVALTATDKATANPTDLDDPKTRTVFNINSSDMASDIPDDVYVYGAGNNDPSDPDDQNNEIVPRDEHGGKMSSIQLRNEAQANSDDTLRILVFVEKDNYAFKKRVEDAVKYNMEQGRKKIQITYADKLGPKSQALMTCIAKRDISRPLIDGDDYNMPDYIARIYDEVYVAANTQKVDGPHLVNK